MGRIAAVLLRWGAVVLADQAAGQAHIAREGLGILLVEVGLAGLPAEAAEYAALLRAVPDAIGAPGNAIAIGVVRVGIGQDGRLGYGFQQAQADHRRRYARRELGIRMQGAIAQLADLQPGLAQLDLKAIGQADGLRAIADPHLGFGGCAWVGHVLQLATVVRLAQHAQALDDRGVFAGRRQRQAHQHRHRTEGIGRRRMAAAVLDMAVLAGVGIEQRAQTVARGGGGRGRDPGVAEETVADAEIQAARGRQIGRGQGEGVLIGFMDRGATGGQRFARFGLGKARGLIAAGQAEGEEQGEQAAEQRVHRGDPGRRIRRASLAG